MLDELRFRKISNEVFSLAGGYEVELIGISKREGLARFGNNKVSQHVDTEDIELVIRVQKDHRQGKSSSNQLDRGSVERAVRKAVKIAESQKKQADLLEFPPPQRYHRLNPYVERTVTITPSEKVDRIREVVSKCQKKKLTAAGIFSNGYQSVGITNTRGLHAFGVYTSASFSLTVMTTDSSGWAETTHRNVDEIHPHDLCATAIDKALRSRRPKSLAAGCYTVVLEPSAVAELLLFMAWDAFGALPYQEGRSFVSKKMEKRVLDERVSLVDDVYHPQTIGIPFDYEGMPRRRVVLIEKGVSHGVVYDRKTARFDRAASTGHGLPQPNTHGPLPLNLVMSHGDNSLEDLISSTQRGLLVTHFHYTNLMDPMTLSITGMTRDGTFLIEEGQVRRAVKNMRFTESIVNCFNRIEAIGRDAVYASSFWGSGIVTPPVKIRDFNFSSSTTF
jgi:PmbA protein